MSHRVFTVINPAAGQAEPILDVMNRVFSKAGATWDVGITHSAGDGSRIARQAAADGYDIIAAYGGDGTCMEVANGVMDSDSVMGILPGGTGNVLSIELSIPQDLESALNYLVAKNKEIQSIGVGKCGEEHFLLRVAAGFPAQSVSMVSRELRDQYGRFAYFLAGLKAIPESRSVTYRIELDDDQLNEVEGFALLISNAASLGIPGTSIAENASITDGVLDVFIGIGLNLGTAAAVALSAAGIEESEDLLHFRAQKVHIEAEPSQPVIYDGEPWGNTPFSVEVLKRALRVIAPKTT